MEAELMVHVWGQPGLPMEPPRIQNWEMAEKESSLAKAAATERALELSVTQLGAPEALANESFSPSLSIFPWEPHCQQGSTSQV